MEDSLAFWEVLHQTVDDEPSYAGYHKNYGELPHSGSRKANRSRRTHG